MPTTRNHRGGRLSRARRKQRRLQRSIRIASGIYGPVTRVAIEYYGRFDITDNDWSPSWGMKHVPFGNLQIFSGSYTGYKVFREYRLKYAQFKLTHELIKTAKWKREEHCEIATYSVASFLQDYDVAIHPNGKGDETWDAVCSHPGSKKAVVTTGTPRNTTHIWRPTEASDTDWRLTENDGLCHLYIVGKKLDRNNEGLFDKYGHSISTVVDVRIHLELRGIDIQTSDTMIRSPNASGYRVNLNQLERTMGLKHRTNTPTDAILAGPSPLAERPDSSNYAGDSDDENHLDHLDFQLQREEAIDVLEKSFEDARIS